jgi:hypothetical protein
MIDSCAHDPAAADLYDALLHRDHRWAAGFLESVTDPDDRAFYLSVCAKVPGLQEWIGTWAREEPRSTLPLLVRGAHAVHWAWEARHGPRAAVPAREGSADRRFPGFAERLELAEACLGEVAARDPADTAAWTFLLTAARAGRAEPDEARRRFERVIDLHAEHLRAHTEMFAYICSRRNGDHAEMFAFARGAVAGSRPGSPLGRLVADAHIEMWLTLPHGQGAAYMLRDEVRADLRAAADHSVRHPDHRPQAGWPEVHNAFAFAFALAGDGPAARDEFDLIGDRVTASPWYYHRPDPVRAFEELRAGVL